MIGWMPVYDIRPVIKFSEHIFSLFLRKFFLVLFVLDGQSNDERESEWSDQSERQCFKLMLTLL